MRAARTFALFALIPLFAACQLFESEPAKPSLVGLTRMQGELTAVGGKLLFQPCDDKRNYVVNDTGGTSVLQEAASLAGQQGILFADLRGKFSGVASGTRAITSPVAGFRTAKSEPTCAGLPPMVALNSIISASSMKAPPPPVGTFGGRG